MSAVALRAGAFGAVVRRDLWIFLSYRTRMFSQILTSLFSLTLFHYVSRLVYVPGFASADAYYGFVVVGIALIAVLYSCFSIAELVRTELVAGTFERLLLSPFGPASSIVAMALFPLLYAAVVSGVTIGLGALLFGMQMHWATVPLAIPVLALALCAFLPFGLFFAALTVATKQGSFGTSWMVALISLVGGLYFPVTLLPGWAELLAKLQPFTPATELLRHLLTDSPLVSETGIALAKLLGFAAVLLPLSLWVLGRAVRYGQRRGTIIEY